MWGLVWTHLGTQISRTALVEGMRADPLPTLHENSTWFVTEVVEADGTFHELPRLRARGRTATLHRRGQTAGSAG